MCQLAGESFLLIKFRDTLLTEASRSVSLRARSAALFARGLAKGTNVRDKLKLSIVFTLSMLFGSAAAHAAPVQWAS